jgi:hypothetical protein
VVIRVRGDRWLVLGATMPERHADGVVAG